MKIKQHGFTLIELLVVISIIGILSSIVLASLNSARTKAKDASAKGSIASAQTSAELYNASNSSYSSTGISVAVANLDGAGTGGASICTDADVVKTGNGAYAQLPTANHIRCAVGQSGASYVVYATLNDGTIFCVDSNGFSGKVASVLSTGGSSADAKCQ